MVSASGAAYVSRAAPGSSCVASHVADDQRVGVLRHEFPRAVEHEGLQGLAGVDGQPVLPAIVRDHRVGIPASHAAADLAIRDAIDDDIGLDDPAALDPLRW